MAAIIALISSSVWAEARATALKITTTMMHIVVNLFIFILLSNVTMILVSAVVKRMKRALYQNGGLVCNLITILLHKLRIVSAYLEEIVNC
jgi:hypothetical protein